MKNTVISVFTLSFLFVIRKTLYLIDLAKIQLAIFMGIIENKQTLTLLNKSN